MDYHLGNPADVQSVLKIAKKNKLLVLEDCATALGAKINKKHVGNFGNVGVFSFLSNKTYDNRRRWNGNFK